MSTTAIDVANELGLIPGVWLLDHDHSSVGFSIRHLGLARVRGRFGGVEARLDVGPSLAATRVEARIDLATIDTGNVGRDAHLRTADFFDTDRHPRMRFASTRIVGFRPDALRLEGDLTLNGRTRPIVLDVEFNGVQVFFQSGKRHAGFVASGTLRRSDFGIEFGLLAIGGDTLALGDEVKIELDLEFVEPDAESQHVAGLNV